MKKIMIMLVMTVTVVTVKAQVPYFAGTVGNGKLYGYWLL